MTNKNAKIPPGLDEHQNNGNKEIITNGTNNDTSNNNNTTKPDIDGKKKTIPIRTEDEIVTDDNNNNNNNNNNNTKFANNNNNNNNNKGEQKLRPEAPEFDGLSGYDPHSNIDPYAHPLGVSTRPEYVPPAEIPPKNLRTTPVTSGNPTVMYPVNNTQPPHGPHQQQMYAAAQARANQMGGHMQGHSSDRHTTHPHMSHGPLPQEPSPHMNPHHIGTSGGHGVVPTGPYAHQHGMVPGHGPHGMVSRSGMGNGQNRTVIGSGMHMPTSHVHMQSGGIGQNQTGPSTTTSSRSETTRSQTGTSGTIVSGVPTSSNTTNSTNLNMMGSGYGHGHGMTNPTLGGYESGHSQHSGEEITQEPSQPKQRQLPPTQAVYQGRNRGDMVYGGQHPGNTIPQQPSPQMYSKHPPQLVETHPGHSLHPRMPVPMPFGAPMRPPGYDKTKQYQLYSEEDENAMNTRMQQPMKGNMDMRQYEFWKSQNRYPPHAHGPSPPITTGVGMLPDPSLIPNAPGGVGVPVTTNQPTTGLTAMPQSGHKSVSRNFGAPKPEDIDPEFTNAPDFVRYQRWELLESAKRWLPGEGTVITWKGYCYVIGAPIHMGMNGHIHFCYRYKLPESVNGEESTVSTNTNTNNTRTTTNETEGDAEWERNTGETNPNRTNDSSEEKRGAHSSGNEQRTTNAIHPYKFTKKDVATVAAKIVPNTSAFAREIVILRDLQECENVTTLYDVLESKRTLISILELAKADVYHFFVGREASRHGWSLEKPAVREAFARMVVTNAVQGLKQMHDKGYLHCDLKSLNVLLYIYRNQNSRRQGGVYMKAKLTDFGHSSKGKYRTAETTFRNGMARVGTAGHVAPELFKEGTPCDYKIDIWSLGIVMFSMLVPGRLLFGEYTDLESLKKAYDALNKMNPWSNQQRPNWWTDFERLSPEARDLILWMTRFNAEERPTGDQIMRHPWFQISMGNLKPGQYRPKLKYVDMLCSSSIAQE